LERSSIKGALVYDPWKDIFGNFSPTDGTVDFYTRVTSFLRPEHVVLDLGAGRAAWFEDDRNQVRKHIRLLKGKAAKVVAADIDAAVLENRTADEVVVLREAGPLPFPDESFDVVVADYVLEHLEDPAAFASEVRRILKPGGLFAARTPHKYCYVAVAARAVANAKHANVLRRVQPQRKAFDVFPTRYRLNTLKDVKRAFTGFESRSFIFRSDPAYYFGNSLVFSALDVAHRLMPSFVSGNIFIFALKR
jgi:SAM-dependent methyltransferase